MINGLTRDVCEIIYRKMPVNDRTRFNIALPKTHKVYAKTPTKEKHLGILNKEIKKRTVTQLSAAMQEFLTSCDADDPTLDDIAELIPNAKNQKKASDFLDRLKTNSLIKSDYEDDSEGEIAQRYRPEEILKALAFTKDIKAFEQALKLPYVLKCVKNAHTSYGVPFMFHILNNVRKDIMEYLDVRGLEQGIDVDRLKSSVGDYSKHLLCNAAARGLMLKHIAFDQSQLNMMAKYCLEIMNIDAYESIHKILKEAQENN